MQIIVNPYSSTAGSGDHDDREPDEGVRVENAERSSSHPLPHLRLGQQ
jgi:hypothetical protein